MKTLWVIALATYALGAAFVACGSNAPAIKAAEVKCLDIYGVEIAQAFAQATPAGDAVGIVLSAEAAACLGEALGAKVIVAHDAGRPPG